MNPVETSVREMLEAYKSAVWNREVEDFLALYAPAARVFDTWAVWCHDGAAARRGAITQWFGSLGTDRVRVEFSDVQVSGDGALVMATAVCTFVGLSAEGAELRSMQNRFTWGLERAGGGLRVVHEHTSVPISSRDMTAIFHRADAA